MNAFGVMCAELGVYTSRSTGAQFVTLQAEGFCVQYFGGPYERCETVNILGSVVSRDPADYTDWTLKSCTQTCQYSRTYFYPFGGLPISRNNCDYGVWGVIGSRDDSYLTISNNGPFGYLLNNIDTPTYNVCENSNGSITYRRVA